MTALAPALATGTVVAAPRHRRPVPVSGERPLDRIAFRGRRDQQRGHEAPDDAGPALAWSEPLPPRLPDPEMWAGALVRTCVEALLGARPAAQLSRWLTGDLYEALLHRISATLGPPPAEQRRVRVLRVRTMAVDETRYEAAVVLHDGRRVRAAAVRIECYRGRWRAVALEIG